MTRSLLAPLLIAGLCAGFFVSDALADLPCGPVDMVEKNLADQYRETLHGQGLDEKHGVLFRVYTSVTGSWTYAILRPDNLLCVIGFGTDWQIELPETMGEKL